MDLAGRLAEIWRYPVSSIGGESIERAQLTTLGVAGDRNFGLIDSNTGEPAVPEKDHRWRKALHLTASSVDGDLPIITFPNGQSYGLRHPSLAGVLSDYFGFAAAICTYAHTGQTGFPISHYRHQHFPTHLLTTASLERIARLCHLETVDCRRFRPNFLIEVAHGEGFVENHWTGKHLRMGTVGLTTQEDTKRCGITFISQPDIEENPEILRNILRHNKRNLGIYCSVDSAGTVEVGDEVLITDEQRRHAQCQV